MAWGINEWFGHPVANITPEHRKNMADDVLSGAKNSVIGRTCPFVQHLMPGALCNKRGGVCSIIPYEDVEHKTPAAVCPRRLLQMDSAGRDIFDLLASQCLGVKLGQNYVVVREVPFLLKVDEAGEARGSKAGRIDWVLVSDADNPTKNWLAIETQAVYFSGDSMQRDFEMLQENPNRLAVTEGSRRPDWRSSAAKRLSPQLEDKQPVMIRWGKKVAVVVDEGFFDEFAAFQNDNVTFDNADVVWVVAGYDENLQITLRIERYAELNESIRAISATRPVDKKQFENALAKHISDRSSKVHIKTIASK